MSSSQPSEVDVLIVGAGPAGLMCATALSRAGVGVKIIDKRAGQVVAGQADGFSPRTLEVLQSYGLADRVLREGNAVYMAAFYDPGPDGGIQLSGRAPDITEPSARYPQEHALHQGAVESLFLDTMKIEGVEVQRSTIPTKIELSTDEVELADPSSHPVKVTLERVNGEPREEIVRAKYVLGADGAHSWVRKTLGIAMEGEQTEFIWGVVDMVPKTNFPDTRKKSLVHSNSGSCLMVPREKDRVRFYVQLTDKDLRDPQTGRLDKDRMGPGELLQVAQNILKPFTLEPSTEILWWTVYIIGQRVASQFSIKNRIFIAGDACHTHSPKAGQGMNASINDTHNLAWKLAYVIRGWADISMLSTYEHERRKFAQELIAFDKTFASQFSGKPLTSDNLDGVSHEQFLKTFQTFGGFSSGIGVHYHPSAIVNDKNQALATNLIIGKRVPPQMFIRGADSAPCELQDLLPSDFRYKALVFIGDLDDGSQSTRVESMAKDLEQPGSFSTVYADRVNVITIAKGTKEKFNWMKTPAVLRPHWSKILLDGVDVKGSVNGRGYSYYGVCAEGAIVVVRPDGYIGTIAPLEGVAQINDYFAQFMKI